MSTAAEPRGRLWPERGLALLQPLLDPADVRLNGERPWDPQIKDTRMLRRVLAQGSLGLGESYMDGDWECAALDEFFARILRARVDEQVVPLRLALHALRHRLFNLQTLRRAFHVGEHHYDLGNDFYAAMLDRRMTYTCGYWQQGAQDLDQAQEAKLELTCRKLMLEPGMRVLDIGCGWGSFARYAAERYGVEVVGITVSREQAALAEERCSGLPVSIRLQDYRQVQGSFDRIVSLGMFEHVGRKNHRAYFEVARRCLVEDGLFLLHTIGKNRSESVPDPWLDRYIFPNGDLPSLAQIARATEGLFTIEDVHNFGADYDKTLMAWHRNFEAAWPRQAARYPERFHRMWRYYLLSCAGAFRARVIQLYQVVLSPQGVAGGYPRPGL